MQIHRGARIGLRVLGGVLAASLLLVGLTITLLMTTWGGERLRRLAVARVNDQIQGHLDIARLSFRARRVVVENVQLRDSDGRFVASVARAEVDVAPFRLLHEELRIEGVSIATPVLELVSGQAGTNLARALRPRHPTPPKQAQPKTGEEGWVVRLDRFVLTGGAITLTTRADAPTDTKLHVTDLAVHASARYAAGNGNLDVSVRLDGQSVQAPTGPLRLAAETHVRGHTVQLSADGALLGGTLLARANVDGQRPSAAQVHVNIDIPAVTMAGDSWGPVRVEADAEPDAVPRLALLLELPGVTLRGNCGGRAQDGVRDAGRFDLTARLTASDLALTAKAVRALTDGTAAPIGGRGTVEVTLGGPMAGAPESWSGAVTVDIPRLAVGGAGVNALALTARVARLSSQPEDARLALAVAALHTGKTLLRGIVVSGTWHAKDITVAAKLSAPEPAELALAARMDDSWHGLTLTRLDLTFPAAAWAMDSAALVGFRGDTLSVNDFSLSSRGQTVAIDGRKQGQSLSAHIALEHLRLEALPALLIDPSLRLAGDLGVDVKASGTAADPRVVAGVRLEHGRVRGFSRLGARAAATLAGHRVDGTLDVDAPYVAARAQFALPTNVAGNPDAPIDLKLDVARLDLGDVLRGAASTARFDGRLTAQLRASGSAALPELEATLTGKELQVSPGSKPAKTPPAIDLGHGHLRVTYARAQAKAELDFASSQGGVLRVDAATHVDLSYPRVTEGLAVLKLPVRGKVAAKELDVAWLAQLSERVQALAGKVDADARLSGTLGDPRFIGDVRWKNGKLIATAAGAPAAGARANARAAAPRARRGR